MEAVIQADHLIDKATLSREDTTLPMEENLEVYNQQIIKIKTLHCRVCLGGRLCPFGLQSSERDSEISFIISNGLPSVKMPLLLEYKCTWKSEHLLLEVLTFSPRPRLFGSQIQHLPPIPPTATTKGQNEKETTTGQIIPPTWLL